MLLHALGVLLAYLNPTQKAIAGTMECAVPFFQQEIKVGDRNGHSMSLTQRNCRWTEPLEAESIASRETILSLFTDIREDQMSERGYAVTSMSNGDRLFFHFVALDPRDGGQQANTIAFSGGNGRFEAISGTGTFSVERNPEQTIVVRIRASYSLPVRSVK